MCFHCERTSLSLPPPPPLSLSLSHSLSLSFSLSLTQTHLTFCPHRMPSSARHPPLQLQLPLQLKLPLQLQLPLPPPPPPTLQQLGGQHQALLLLLLLTLTLGNKQVCSRYVHVFESEITLHAWRYIYCEQQPAYKYTIVPYNYWLKLLLTA